MRYILRLSCLFVFMLVRQTSNLSAQSSSFEFWPEADIWYRLNSSWRLSVFAPLADYMTSQSSDLNVYVQADYAWGHPKKLFFARLMDENRAQYLNIWLVRPGVMQGWSVGENGDYHEDMLFGEIHRRIPVGDKALHSIRWRPELRWLGEDGQFSYRIRCRLMIEREYTFRNWSYVPYVNVEPYWDSRYTDFSRVRVIGGTTVSWGPRFGLEGNLTYQYDEHYNTPNTYAINVILHMYFGKYTSNP